MESLGFKKFIATIVTSHIITFVFGLVVGVVGLLVKAEVPVQFWGMILFN